MGRTVHSWHSVVKEPGVIRSLADVCVRPDSEEKTVDKVVRQAGLEKTVPSAVSAVMGEYVIRCLEAAPADWVGLGPAVTWSVLQEDMV